MRIFLSGNEDGARFHLPVAHAKVAAFADHCRKSGLKQNTFAFIFKETGTQVFASYSFGQVQMRVHSPVKPREEDAVEMDRGGGPSLVVFVGDETLGYNFAVLDIVGDGVLYGRADTARDVVTTFQPVDQREHHVRRYSVKTDRSAFDAMEYLSENYAEGGVIDLFSSTSPGVKCSTVVAARCPELPAGDSEMYECQSTDADGGNALGYLVAEPVVQAIASAFTARAWCYARNTGTYRSFWAQKREITTSTLAAVNRVSFGADVYEVRGSGQEDAVSESLSTFYGLFSDEYDCTAGWLDDGSVTTNMLVGYGSLIIEKVNSPAGLAVALGSDVVQRIHEFYNSDEDQLAYGKSEPFTAPFDDDLYDAAVAAGAVEDGTLPLGMYAYSDPGVFTSHATATASFYCPLTRYENAKGTPEFIASYDGGSENDAVTYSNIEAKGVSLSVEYDGGVYEVYFKHFLEAKFTRDSGTGMFTKSDVAPVSVGAAQVQNGSGFSLVSRLHNAFMQFRQDDLAASRITADDPWPVHGSVMCYLYEREKGASYLLDEIDLYERINALRGSLSAPPLALNIDLCVAARIHAEDMATNEFLSHEGSDGSWPSQRIDGTGFCGGATERLEIGENCGYGYETSQDQFNAWVASSEGHYEAMINPKFREVGLALAVNDGVAYRCAVFAGDSDI